MLQLLVLAVNITNATLSIENMHKKTRSQNMFFFSGINE